MLNKKQYFLLYKLKLMTKKIHIINHVDFESAGYISDWIAENDLILSETNIYNNDNFPDLADFDCLVSMGGPMKSWMICSG